jgi:hypothetical protein
VAKLLEFPLDSLERGIRCVVEARSRFLRRQRLARQCDDYAYFVSPLLMMGIFVERHTRMQDVLM